MSDRMLRCNLTVEVRGIDEEKRQATFVASTETPVKTWDGPEVLRMAGARLERYRSNPVLLDSHNRGSLGSVIGRADVKREGRQLVATATYADTPNGENAWRLVKGGFVRAMSIGFDINPKRVIRLREGQTDGEGEAQVTGPAIVVREWELLEISNVAVPADQNAVRRSYLDSVAVGHEEIKGDDDMSGARSGLNFGQMTGRDGQPTGELGATRAAAAAPPAAPAVAPAPITPLPPAEQLAANEAAARHASATRAHVLAFTPRGLEEVSERGLLEGLSVEQIRQRLIETQAKRFAPIGTPEPTPPAADVTRAAPLPDDFDELAVRAFGAGR